MKTITTTEAAKRLKVKPQTVASYCANGKLRGELVGRQWSVNAASVAAYSKANRKPGPKGKP